MEVSVPCRGTTFLNIDMWYGNKKEQATFPSPVGELHFSMVVDLNERNSFQGVSVPCRGTTFLNAYHCAGGIFPNGFPSPVGELHFSIYDTKELYEQLDRFPSPVGELHFSIENSIFQYVCRQSFRPLSGNYISQFFKFMFSFSNIRFVSVPCRGTTFLNVYFLWSQESMEGGFPSPVGELHFSIYNQSQVDGKGYRFPSPVGELHFSIMHNCLRLQR